MDCHWILCIFRIPLLCTASMCDIGPHTLIFYIRIEDIILKHEAIKPVFVYNLATDSWREQKWVEVAPQTFQLELSKCHCILLLLVLLLAAARQYVVPLSSVLECIHVHLFTYCTLANNSKYLLFIWVFPFYATSSPLLFYMTTICTSTPLYLWGKYCRYLL